MPPYFSKEQEFEHRIKCLEDWKREHEKREDDLESKQAKAALSAILNKKTAPEDCILVAHSTGDGWQLGVETVDGEVVALLAWPKIFPSVMSADKLRDKGFEVV